MTNVAKMSAMLEQIGREALAVRVLELSMIARMTAGDLSTEDRAEWESLLIERREYLGAKTDEFMAVFGIKPSETLASLRANRDRRAGK